MESERIRKAEEAAETERKAAQKRLDDLVDAYLAIPKESVSAEQMQRLYNQWSLCLVKRRIIAFFKRYWGSYSEIEQQVYMREIQMVVNATTYADVMALVDTCPHGQEIRTISEYYCYHAEFWVRMRNDICRNQIDMGAISDSEFLVVEQARIEKEREWEEGYFIQPTNQWSGRDIDYIQLSPIESRLLDYFWYYGYRRHEEGEWIHYMYPTHIEDCQFQPTKVACCDCDLMLTKLLLKKTTNKQFEELAANELFWDTDDRWLEYRWKPWREIGRGSIFVDSREKKFPVQWNEWCQMRHEQFCDMSKSRKANEASWQNQMLAFLDNEQAKPVMPEDKELTQEEWRVLQAGYAEIIDRLNKSTMSLA